MSIDSVFTKSLFIKLLILQFASICPSSFNFITDLANFLTRLIFILCRFFRPAFLSKDKNEVLFHSFVGVQAAFTAKFLSTNM